MKKNFFFLSSYPHSAPGNRLNVFCQFRMLQSVGSPPPLGEGARDGCGRQPLRSGRADGEADTAQITQSVSDTALPSCEGGTPEQASPLEGRGGEADPGGSPPQRRAPP